MGISSLSARVGGVSAPFVVLLSEVSFFFFFFAHPRVPCIRRTGARDSYNCNVRSGGRYRRRCPCGSSASSRSVQVSAPAIKGFTAPLWYNLYGPGGSLALIPPRRSALCDAMSGRELGGLRLRLLSVQY
eukprot:2069568-Rhodomonas_salina.2